MSSTQSFKPGSPALLSYRIASPLRLFFIVAGILVLVDLAAGGFTWWFLQQTKALSEQKAESYALGQAQLLEESVLRTFAHLDGALLGSADEYRLYKDGRLPREALNAYIARVTTNLATPYGLRVTDRSGVIAFGDNRNAAPSSIADRPFFTALRNNPKASVVSQIVSSKVPGQSSLVFARRISATDGSFDGITYTAISLEEVGKQLSRAAVGYNGFVALRDEAGLARFTGSTAVRDGLARTASAEDGVPRLYAFRRIADHPLHIIVGLDPSAYLGDWREMASTTVAAVLGFLVLSVLIARRVYGDCRRRLAAIHDLAGRENAFRTVFEAAPVGMELVSLDGKLLKVNVALCEMLGYSMDELSGKPLAKVTDPDDIEKDRTAVELVISNKNDSMKIEKRYIHKDGHTIWTQRTVTLARDEAGKPSYLIAQIEDITERKEEQSEIHGLAHYDTLTGLPNRRMLMNRLGRHLKQAHWNQKVLALMFIDLDGFKKINDTLGHDVGDELLKAAAGRLSSCVRGDDTVARLGGDEFVVILKEIPDPANAALVAQKVVTTIAAPIQVASHELRVTASIGIGIFSPAKPVDMDELIKQADTAMYWTKQAGRNGYHFFDSKRAAEQAA